MKDINGIEIRVGQRLKTQQHAGGILPPDPAQIGNVILKKYNNIDRLMIEYKKEGQDFNRYIMLDGQINEVLNAL